MELETSAQITDDLLYACIQDIGENRKWHLKYAKFSLHSHQSLLTHSLNVASLSANLLDFLNEKGLIKINDKLHVQAIITGFLHDAGKESPLFQEAVKLYLSGNGPQPLDFCHQQENKIQPVIDALKEELSKKGILPQEIFEEAPWIITQLGKREDSAAISHSFQRAPSKDALICKEIIHLSDILASKFAVEDVVNVPLDGEITSKLMLVYSKVCQVRGVLTHFLHMAIEEQFEEQGFKAIQWFPDGTAYVSIHETANPVLNKDKLSEAISSKMDELGENHSRQMAKAAFGSITQQVIAAPEFLFSSKSDVTIREFWKFISNMKFAKTDVKNKVNDLTDSEKRLFNVLSQELENETEVTKLVFLSRFIADFNLLIVLYGARKQLIESIPKDKKSLEQKIIQEIDSIISQTLDIPVAYIKDWPEIALQTKTEKRLSVAKSLWQSKHYDNPNVWHTKLLNALTAATIEMAKRWQEIVPNKYKAISNRLLADVTAPISPEDIIKEANNLSSVIAKGKTGHGTQTCQKCGAVATIEAQAKLFGGSEIYHDQLVAGGRVGGGNKLQVCELCEFEEKLRLMFLESRTGYSNSFYVFPQLSLTRKQQMNWQSTMTQVEFNQGNKPSLIRLNQWAENLIGGSTIFSDRPQFNSYFSENELARTIQYIAERNGIEKDLSPLIEPALSAENAKAIIALVNQGKAKLKKEYNEEIYKNLNQVEPIYLSPNYMLILTRGSVAEKEEPESSAEIKWLYFRTLLARMFNAAIIPETHKNSEKCWIGYTPVPSNLNLKTLTTKLNSKRGWIDIPDLDYTIRKLSALLVVARELSNSKADYGKGTLLRLLNEEPGRILNRIAVKNGIVTSKKLLNSLNIWYRRDNA